MSVEALEKLRVTKYNIILYLGVLFLFLSIRYQVEFLEEKNLFGLSIGMIVSGLTVLLGHRTDQIPIPGGFVSQEHSSLGNAGLIILIVGVSVSITFLYRIVIQVF